MKVTTKRMTKTAELIVDSRLNACSFPAKWRANVFCSTNACISPAMKNPSKMYGDILLSMNNNAFYIISLECNER